MKPTSRKFMRVIPAILMAFFLIVILSGCGNFVFDNTSTSTGWGQDAPTTSYVPTTSRLSTGIIKVSDLPSEARTTLQLIKSGGPFPYEKDGTVFYNYEGLLPKEPSGYYHEYTVITPGSPDRGARRIVAGSNGKYYYTDDHYNTFKLVVE